MEHIIKEKTGKLNNKFSIRRKLVIIFGLLVILAMATETFFAVRTARLAITTQIEKRLMAKASDTAEIIEKRMQGTIKLIEGLSALRYFYDDSLNYNEKLRLLLEEVKNMKAAKNISEWNMADINGNLYSIDGSSVSIKDREWFKEAMKGKSFITEPFITRSTNSWVIMITMPIFDKDNKVISILCANIPGDRLCKLIEDIKIGDTGYCYVVGTTGNVIGVYDFQFVKDGWNSQKEAEKNSEYKRLAETDKKSLEKGIVGTAQYHWKEGEVIAGYANMNVTGWGVIVRAPYHEFMDDVTNMRNTIVFIELILILIMLVVIYIIATQIIKPINTTVKALKNIAQGEGDLTVRLPVRGDDEITQLSQYFNETIEKIGSSIKVVLENTISMTKIGENLATNMTETASSINEISANIDGVKGQALTQSTSVTETSATMEEIIRTIQQLNNGIEHQVQTIEELISVIHESDSTTAKTKNILKNNDELILQLSEKSAQGREVINVSGQEVQKITEESGSLIEATNIIQNIASQTNLLAMNAAIEAAHAGDAGKGFAVVADEIRKLAEESSTQGKFITSALKTLSTEIETVASSSKNLDESFSAMFNLVKEVKNRSGEIMEVAEARKEQSEHLMQLIEKVNSVTNEVKNGSHEMLRGGEQVASEMRKLDDLTRVITDSMNEMASGAVQINGSVQEVREMTHKNKTSINALSDEVNKFKV